jgi:hypothetical protein
MLSYKEFKDKKQSSEYYLVVWEITPLYYEPCCIVSYYSLMTSLEKLYVF